MGADGGSKQEGGGITPHEFQLALALSTIQYEMASIFGGVYEAVGISPKQLGGVLKSMEKSRQYIEDHGGALTPRQRANMAMMNVKYRKYMESDSETG